MYHASNKIILSFSHIKPKHLIQTRLIHATTVISLSICISLGGMTESSVNAQALPELNDSASQVLNAEDEIILGRKLMLDARKRLRIINDPLLQNYLQSLTDFLATKSARPLPDIKVSLAQNSSINAFAAPGGQIAINTGLISATQSEGEFASVIAHEISHHSQRHIPRMLENAEKMSLPSTAALIGGLLIGGQAGLATIATVRAAVVSNQLAYSRGFEQEADAAGMALLAQAGYDPVSMPTFFGRLERQSQLQGSDAPEFLRTHPLSNNRIADAQARAKTLSKTTANPARFSALLDFDSAKVRSHALYDGPLDPIVNEFADKAKSNTAVDNDDYGYGLVLTRAGKYSQAQQVLQDALQSLSTQIANAQFVSTQQSRLQSTLTYALAELYYKQSQSDDALKQLLTLQQQWADNYAVEIAIARTLKQAGKLDEVYQKVRKTMRRHPQQSDLILLLSDIAGAQGNFADAALNRAQYLFDTANFEQALFVLEPFVNGPKSKSSPYLLSRMEDLKRQITASKRRFDALNI